MRKFPFNTFLMRRKPIAYRFYFENYTFYFEIRYQNRTIFSGRDRKSLGFSFRFSILNFSKKKFFAKKIYPSNLIDLFVLRIIYFSYIAIFIVCNIPYNCTDDRKMSITCENDDKTARRSFVYKIPGHYFRCNAFSQIRGCPSLGTKSHGSISRAKALHAREISKRCQYGLNL